MFKREPNTQYILSLSYGKDSLACLEAIKSLCLPLDRIVHFEVWATDTISADLPPMVNFKAKADKIIFERYGIEVEHISAISRGEKATFEKIFYRKRYNKKKQAETIYGFPCIHSPWCNSRLKMTAMRQMPKSDGVTNIVRYLGIASDEPERIKRHTKQNIVLPLVLAGWDEAYCLQWCKENDLLSPIYSSSTRGGCWFCHNQSIDQLRKLRHNYPELWDILLKWDADSPVPFHADGRTVHDFDMRFALEDEGKVPADRRFKWRIVDEMKTNKWLCESCVYYPPSSGDGKPCSMCDINDADFNHYCKREKE